MSKWGVCRILKSKLWYWTLLCPKYCASAGVASGGAAMPASTARLRAVITDVPDRYTRGVPFRHVDARQLPSVAVMKRTKAGLVRRAGRACFGCAPNADIPAFARMSGPATDPDLGDQAPEGARTGQSRS